MVGIKVLGLEGPHGSVWCRDGVQIPRALEGWKSLWNKAKDGMGFNGV